MSSTVLSTLRLLIWVLGGFAAVVWVLVCYLALLKVRKDWIDRQ